MSDPVATMPPMSYGGGHRLDGMEPISEGHDASRDILNHAVPTLQQFHEEREVAMRYQEVERNALDFTVARFRLLAERWAHQSERAREEALVATHANVAGLNLPPDLVALAYNQNNGDIVNTLMDLTEPILRRGLERELAEHREHERERAREEAPDERFSESERLPPEHQEEQEEEEEEGEGEEEEVIVQAQDALRQAAEALARSEARAQRSIGTMRDRHQEARNALGRFQGAVAELVALRRAQVAATEVAATQPSPVLGKSVRVRELARAMLTKEREDLEEQMERMEITEGVYLERMNALRDRYNRAPYGLALSADASTRAGNNLPFEMRPRVTRASAW